MIGDASPVFGLSENLSDLPEAELRIYAPHKNLFIRLADVVQDPLYPFDLLAAFILLRHGWSKVGNFPHFIFIQLLRPSVFSDI